MNPNDEVIIGKMYSDPTMIGTPVMMVFPNRMGEGSVIMGGYNRRDSVNIFGGYIMMGDSNMMGGGSMMGGYNLMNGGNVMGGMEMS